MKKNSYTYATIKAIVIIYAFLFNKKLDSNQLQLDIKKWWFEVFLVITVLFTPITLLVALLIIVFTEINNG